MLTTATDLLITGGREGYFHVLDAQNGDLLYSKNLGGQIVMAPATYMADGTQYISIIYGNSLFTYGLKDL